MNKLLAAYLTRPTLANAKKVVAYGRKHPFSACLLTQFDTQLLADAAAHVNGTKAYPTQRVEA